MKKQEVIKQAYGEYWETVKVFIDKNGWFSINGFMPNFIEDFDEIGYGQTKRIRPKSLQGIENNNGWIKIESDEDLPNKNTDCYIMYSDKSISIDIFLVITKQFRSNSWKHITHYQPIQKPQPPIY